MSSSEDAPPGPVKTAVATTLTWVGGLAGLGVGSGLAAVTLPFLSQEQRHKWFLAPAMSLNVQLTLSRISILYDREFVKERRGVFIQNHVNMLDGQLACHVIPHAFCGLYNYWHNWIPGYGWVMYLAQGIKVYPKSKGGVARITEQAKNRAERNMSILAFPEGHRTRSGKVGPFKRGAFFMARDAGLPVVPLCVRGMLEVNKPKTQVFRPGHIEVYIGKHIETAGLSDDQLGDLAEQVRNIHVRFVEEGWTPEDAEVVTTKIG